jgi:secretion/DNA translocation related CpaE-like protein
MPGLGSLDGMARNEQEQSDGTGRWIPEAGPVVCCVTGDATLRDECARAAAVAGVVFEGVPAVGGDAGLWTRADLVLLGADVGEVPPQRRGSTVLVGGAGQRRLLWDRAAALGIDHVAELPEAAGWLVEFLGRRGAEGPSGVVVGVVGGCGGAGASTTAVLLAGAAAHHGSRVLLVDGDRLAGGLEAVLGEEPLEGLRWPDLASASGAINPDQLAASLPRAGGAAVLSWPAGPRRAVRVPASAVSAVVEAARSAFDLVVVDVGRGREGLEDFGWASDRILVVVPGTLGGALSAAQLVHELPPVPQGIVVRGRTAEGVDAEQLAGLVGCPLVTRIPHLRRAAGAAEGGRLMELARSRSLRRLAAAVLEALPEQVPPAPADDAAALAVGGRLAGRGRRVAR